MGALSDISRKAKGAVWAVGWLMNAHRVAVGPGITVHALQQIDGA
jgi:hypothetical protein